MKKVLALCWVPLVFVVGWLGFRSTYEFKTYPVAGCVQPVTAVTYWKAFHRGQLFRRGVAFVPGQYRTRAIPSHDCLILPELSGFDAYCEFIPTCENGRIILTSPPGTQIESPGPSTAIISRVLDNIDYLKLRKDNGGNIIVLE